jgi:hypothetical protein
MKLGRQVDCRRHAETHVGGGEWGGGIVQDYQSFISQILSFFMLEV